MMSIASGMSFVGHASDAGIIVMKTDNHRLVTALRLTGQNRSTSAGPRMRTSHDPRPSTHVPSGTLLASVWVGRLVPRELKPRSLSQGRLREGRPVWSRGRLPGSMSACLFRGRGRIGPARHRRALVLDIFILGGIYFTHSVFPGGPCQ
jgi:hypothetical protein